MDRVEYPRDINLFLTGFNWATSSQKWIEADCVDYAESKKMFQLGHFFSEMDSIDAAGN